MKWVYVIDADAPDEMYRKAASSVSISERPYPKEADVYDREWIYGLYFFQLQRKTFMSPQIKSPISTFQLVLLLFLMM